jgi:hypothetical protein
MTKPLNVQYEKIYILAFAWCAYCRPHTRCAILRHKERDSSMYYNTTQSHGVLDRTFGYTPIFLPERLERVWDTNIRKYDTNLLTYDTINYLRGIWFVKL